MKAVILALLLASATAPALADPVCLNVQDIAASQPNRDGTAITFTLNNGKIWRNDLKSPCPDLRFNGFSWLLHGPDEVCDGAQSIRVLQSGQVCQLGKFTQLKPAPHG